MRPFVMTIAGYDPSGGAGVLADIKTMEQLRTSGLAVCTAITVQTESECLDLEWQPMESITRTAELLLKKYPVQTVKIGVVKDAAMLGEILEMIIRINSEIKVIWDPVLKSTSEFAFFDLDTLAQLDKVMDKLCLVTPNWNEYQVLTGNHLFQGNICSVLMKGGHRTDRPGTDVLLLHGMEIPLQPSDESRLYTPKHGSGCVLSSAIASWLARGEDTETACRKAKLYVEHYLKSNPSLVGYHS
ncbi:hydroxymethylpyrimidine/phosphomethylpyrimidine kinase [uncultured Chryseobacterium sp.]|uniref:hydroxymethylpyrimidine/phosphomethylpyrimidine kinase n=1 Tax=uncultured Chryseobacterium sp. TaxID=259322 RepID=UPI0025D1178D|nr:hydroxymethylpyrimidine/phosphomethylpyrimidine kinase [uncultured Chryseobacterium sp.]